MDAGQVRLFETVVDCTAATVLAGAAGYSALHLGSPGSVPVAVAAVAWLAGFRGLSSVGAGSPVLPLPPFDLTALPEPEIVDELLLTDADRLEPSDGAQPDELVLDDVLARLEDFSRVVRLFDRSAMPTPGELKQRIDHHLDGSPPSSAPADASQALHDALSELRRSLR